MLWREVTSREFQTINIQGAGVGEVLLEGGGQGDEGEGRGCGQVEVGSSVRGATADPDKNSQPNRSFYAIKSLVGFNFFLLHKGGRAGVGLILLHQRSADFIKVLLNFALQQVKTCFYGAWCEL
jgi:hypothetical protein